MTKLHELSCTKINHDIIGNVGAVCYAVELLEEDDLDFLEDIKKILKTSSFVLASRLKFFRIAFGSDNVVVDNLTEIIQNYVDTIALKNYPIKVNIINYNKEVVKPLLLIAMIVSALMIKGGSFSVNGNIIEVVSEKFNEEGLAKFFDFNCLEEIPVNASCLYLKEVLSRMSKSLVFSKKENNLIIEVK